MFNCLTKTIEAKIVASITCDCCKKEYLDDLDKQEITHIQSIGDGVEYECDLCSSCVKHLLGKYLRTQ